MSITCMCPSAATLISVPNVECAESFGQIQKVVFQRLKKEDGTLNCFKPGDTTAISKKAAWDAFLAATDSTKMVITPYVYSPADQGGDARMSGGGNDDLGGIPTVLGGNPVQFTGSLRAVPQSVAKAMKPLICEANAGNIGVFLIDENGNIEAIEDSSQEGIYYPIPIRGLFIGDKVHGNYDAKDSNSLGWYYAENYSDDLKIVIPEFNPLIELKNAE